MSHAQQIEAHAAQFLARRQAPDWSAVDQAALDEWLRTSTLHEVTYLRLEYGWSRVDRLAALRDPAPVTAALPAQRPPRWKPWAAAIAASLALVTSTLWYAHRSGYETYATAVGIRQTVPLTDGSHMELNTDTLVRAALDDTARTVWLERGEAYFDIVSDPARPFVVHAGAQRITVLGTKFTVQRDDDSVQVVVTEGRVRLEQADRGAAAAPVIMTSGDAVLSQGGQTHLQARDAQALARELSWRQGMLTFDQTTLGEAAAEFNRYNRRRLQISEAAAGVRIGGSFEATNMAAFVRLLEEGFDLRAVEHGNTIRIDY